MCAYGALIREPLLSAYEILNVHPSLLPRWRGAAPIERAIMAGDEVTGVSIIRLVEALDAGPVCLQGDGADRPRRRLRHALGAAASASAATCSSRALDERPRLRGAGRGRRHLRAQDRGARPRRWTSRCPPEAVERQVRALRPHIGARLPLPGGEFMGVLGARVDGDTLAPAGGRVRVEDGRLLLDCNGGALELTEIRPPGGREMDARAWLRGRPDTDRTGYFLDPALPGRSFDELVELARAEWTSGAEWAPYLSALAYRGDEEVLFRARAMAEDGDPLERGIAAFLLGQLGTPVRTFPAESAAALESMAAREQDPGVLEAIAHGFGHLGDPYGLDTLLAPLLAR